MRELAGGRSVAASICVSDRWQVTSNMWHMTFDMLHVTCDLWHVTWNVLVGLIFLYKYPQSHPQLFQPTATATDLFTSNSHETLLPILMKVNQNFSWDLTSKSHEKWPQNLLRVNLQFSWEFTSNSHDCWVSFAQVPVKRNGHTRPHEWVVIWPWPNWCQGHGKKKLK